MYNICYNSTLKNSHETHFYSLPSAVENLFLGHLRNNIKFAMKIIRWIDGVSFLSIKNICLINNANRLDKKVSSWCSVRIPSSSS